MEITGLFHIAIKTANLAASPYNGVEVSSITRATNVALQEQMLAASR